MMLIFVMVCVVFLQAFGAQTFIQLVLIKKLRGKNEDRFGFMKPQMNLAFSSRVVCI